MMDIEMIPIITVYYYAFIIYALLISSSSNGGGVTTKKQSLSLDKLPLEILLQILQNVSFKDKLSMTCCLNPYLKFVVNVSIYHTIYIVKHGYTCLNDKLTCCYQFDKLNPIYLKYVEFIYNADETFQQQETIPPYALFYNLHHGQVTMVNLRNSYVCGKLTFLELDQNMKLPSYLNNLTSLKIHKDVDVGYCLGVDLESLVCQLKELTIVDDPMVFLKQFPTKLINVVNLTISINVDRLNYKDFWNCLDSTIPLSNLTKLNLIFESSLNLSKNPYVINIESLQYLDEINEFLYKMATTLSTNIKNVSITVKDQRHCQNNIYKKIQPDLNQFLTLLPKSLQKIVVKLSNEFNLGQFHGAICKHSELKEFTFIGNLNHDFLNGYDLKLNMLNGGCLIKDYSMYGKFQKTSDGDNELIKEFEQLSKRCDLDFLSDEMIFNKLNSTIVKDLIMTNLVKLLNSKDGEYANSKLEKINLNGLVFQIGSTTNNGVKILKCISD